MVVRPSPPSHSLPTCASCADSSTCSRCMCRATVLVIDAAPAISPPEASRSSEDDWLPPDACGCSTCCGCCCCCCCCCCCACWVLPRSPTEPSTARAPSRTFSSFCSTAFWACSSCAELSGEACRPAKLAKPSCGAVGSLAAHTDCTVSGQAKQAEPARLQNGASEQATQRCSGSGGTAVMANKTA